MTIGITLIGSTKPQHSPGFSHDSAGDSVKAGDRARTGDIQLGRLSTPSVSTDNVGTCDGASCAPSNSASATPKDTVPATPIDPELAAIVEAWSNLSPALRAGIVAMVAAASGGKRS